MTTSTPSPCSTPPTRTTTNPAHPGNSGPIGPLTCRGSALRGASLAGRIASAVYSPDGTTLPLIVTSTWLVFVLYAI